MLAKSSNAILVSLGFKPGVPDFLKLQEAGMHMCVCPQAIKNHSCKMKPE